MTVIPLTVLMGLVKEAVKRQEERWWKMSEKNAKTAAMLARNLVVYPVLAPTTLKREVARYFSSKSQTLLPKGDLPTRNMKKNQVC